MARFGKVELVLDAKARLGEGAAWDAASRQVCWVNSLDGEVHLFRPSSREDRCITVGQPVGVAVPCRSGALLVTLHHGVGILNPTTGALKVLAEPESDRPENRFSDGRCDARGRFWFGSMRGGGAHGALYRLDPDLAIQREAHDIGISNGIGWSPDGRRMYHVDTAPGVVYSYDYDVGTGAIGRRRVAVECARKLGQPDGLAVDAEGMLWIAMWGTGAVMRWNPDGGDLLEEVQLPVKLASCCAFGGPRLDTLYVTSARLDLGRRDLAGQPGAGGIFAVRPGVCGLPSTPFPDMQ